MKACLQVGIGSSLQEWRPGGEAGEADGALAFSCATCSFEEGPQDGVGRGGERGRGQVELESSLLLTKTVLVQGCNCPGKEYLF